MASRKIEVQGIQIRIEPISGDDYVSLTDLAKRLAEGRPSHTIQNWMKNTNRLRYLATWEKVHNPNFKVIHLDDLMQQAGDNRFIISPKKWVETTAAIGIRTKAGRDGGTFAHQEIALDFCYWLSPEFKVYLNKEFVRLKKLESERQDLEWHISKITDNVEELRNLLDTVPGQDPNRNRVLGE